MIEEQVNYPDKAKKLVEDYYNSHIASTTDPKFQFVGSDEVYVVWFSKTLKNWKALVATTNPDGSYFEVTYNGEKGETYIDAYVKAHNIAIPDRK